MTSKIINLFISSKNMIEDETNKQSITIPDGLLTVRDDEYFIMKVMNFYCYNTQYNITTNNYWLRIGTTNIYLPLGNPNVNDIRDSLNIQFSSLGVYVSYNKIMNKFVFNNNTGTNLGLIIINSGYILGFDNNTTYNILANSSISSVNTVSVITNNAINISITGDIELVKNNLDNLRNGDIQTNNIIFQKLIDTKSNYLIQYENKGDDLYKYTLNNINSINYMTINILNQDLEYINNFGLYYLTLQFQIIKKNEELDVLLSIKEYLYDILQMFFSLLQHYKIM